jgi:hypothetical protein
VNFDGAERLSQWPEQWQNAFNRLAWAFLKEQVTAEEFIKRARVLFLLAGARRS